MPSKREMAWDMRRNMTPAESALWASLRNNQLNGLHFRRQHVIAGKIADFYCRQARLVVEVDGPVHDGLVVHDSARDAVLNSVGFRVLHVSNAEIESDIESVLQRIADAAGA